MILLLLMNHNNATSQMHGGLEQYYYTGVKEASVVPKIYYEAKNTWYGEVHYNYEEFETASLNVGKVFAHKNELSYSITPFAGVVLGKLNGGNLGSNIDADYKKLFFSSESQYTVSIERRTENFFFNWSEAGYQLTEFLYAGFALQVTHPYEIKNNWQPGVMLGLSYKRWTFPVYAFNPGGQNSNFVVGINWEWKKNAIKNTDL